MLHTSAFLVLTTAMCQHLGCHVSHSEQAADRQQACHIPRESWRMHTVLIDPCARACCSYTDHLAMPVPGASDAELSAARAPTAPVQIAAAAAKPAVGGQLPDGAEATAAAAMLDELQRQLVRRQRHTV